MPFEKSSVLTKVLGKKKLIQSEWANYNMKLGWDIKQKQYGELTRTERYINNCVLETEFIINVQPVFYCIDTVTICNSSKIQNLAKSQ